MKMCLVFTEVQMLVAADLLELFWRGRCKTRPQQYNTIYDIAPAVVTESTKYETPLVASPTVLLSMKLE